VAPGHDGLHQAHHGLPLIAVQRITHEHEPLVPQPLQQQRRVEPALVVLHYAYIYIYSSCYCIYRCSHFFVYLPLYLFTTHNYSTSTGEEKCRWVGSLDTVPVQSQHSSANSAACALVLLRTRSTRLDGSTRAAAIAIAIA
jgi:hypothetical protein